MDAQEGGWIVLQNKCSNKTAQELYWFGLPDLRTVLNHPGRVPLYLQVLERVHLEPLQLQVLNRDHLQPYNHKFYTRLTCNLSN